MRKRLTAATLAALMALSMTACSGGKAAETTAAPETKVEETKAEESKAEETKAETEAAADGEKLGSAAGNMKSQKIMSVRELRHSGGKERRHDMPALVRKFIYGNTERSPRGHRRGSSGEEARHI